MADEREQMRKNFEKHIKDSIGYYAEPARKSKIVSPDLMEQYFDPAIQIREFDSSKYRMVGWVDPNNPATLYYDPKMDGKATRAHEFEHTQQMRARVSRYREQTRDISPKIRKKLEPFASMGVGKPYTELLADMAGMFQTKSQEDIAKIEDILTSELTPQEKQYLNRDLYPMRTKVGPSDISITEELPKDKPYAFQLIDWIRTVTSAK